MAVDAVAVLEAVAEDQDWIQTSHAYCSNDDCERVQPVVERLMVQPKTNVSDDRMVDTRTDSRMLLQTRLALVSVDLLKSSMDPVQRCLHHFATLPTDASSDFAECVARTLRSDSVGAEAVAAVVVVDDCYGNCYDVGDVVLERNLRRHYHQQLHKR